MTAALLRDQRLKKKQKKNHRSDMHQKQSVTFIGKYLKNFRNFIRTRDEGNDFGKVGQSRNSQFCMSMFRKIF